MESTEITTHQVTALQQALQRLRTAFIGVGVFSCFLNLLMLATPLYMLSVYQRVLTSGHQDTLIYLTVATVFALLVLGILYWLRGWLLNRISGWLSAEVSGPVLAANLVNVLRGSSAGSQPMRDLGKVQAFIGGQGLAVLLDSPWVPIFVVIIWIMHPVLGILALCSAIILLLLAWINELLLRSPQRAANQQQAKAFQFAETSLRNAEVVQAMGMMPNLRKHWQDLNVISLGEQDLANSRSAFIIGCSRFLRLTAQVGVLGLGAALVLKGELSAGHMIAGAILLGRALAPVEQAMGAWRSFVTARSSYARLQQLLHDIPEQIAAIELPDAKGFIDVENMSYIPYGAEKPILKDISFSLNPGESLSIIGPSAAGKTTLCGLLVGVWPPTTGAVRLDSADVHNWDRQAFGEAVGYLPQDVELFSGSIRENIARMGESCDEQVIAAAQLADVHDMILHLNDGYDTQIGIGSTTLSAGQRQRIGLARVLYGNPKVVVLDEPNANLDRIGELALVRTLSILKAQGVSVIMVVHQANMLAHVDKILMLRDGHIEAFGLRDEIIAKLKQQINIAHNKSAPPVVNRANGTQLRTQAGPE